MKYAHIALMGILFLAAVSRPAHAYIDPGTAGLLLQAIIGGAVGTLFAIRIYWQKIKKFFGLRTETEIKPDQRDQTGD